MKRYNLVDSMGYYWEMRVDNNGEYVKFEDIKQRLTEYFKWDPDIENPAYAAKRFLTGGGTNG